MAQRDWILITGAAGKTGLAAIEALADGGHGHRLRALIRRPEQRAALEALGVGEVFDGDLRDRAAVFAALEGAKSIYHVCPNVHPQEFGIGDRLIELAMEAGIEHFVFHSVLHPQTRAMPHHWSKLRVEERLFESGIGFTILQPAPYMQNLLGQWDTIARQGVYEIPYAPSTRLAMVDLADVGEIAGRVLTETGHRGAIYELTGSCWLDQHEIADRLTKALGRDVVVRVIDRSAWALQAREAGLGDYQIETLLAMFRYYERFGMAGNAGVLTSLLGREPATFEDFLERSERRSSAAALSESREFSGSPGRATRRPVR